MTLRDLNDAVRANYSHRHGGASRVSFPVIVSTGGTAIVDFDVDQAHDTYSFQFSGEVAEMAEFGDVVKAALDALRAARLKASE